MRDTGAESPEALAAMLSETGKRAGDIVTKVLQRPMEVR
jgi:hypothetical protein